VGKWSTEKSGVSWRSESMVVVRNPADTPPAFVAWRQWWIWWQTSLWRSIRPFVDWRQWSSWLMGREGPGWWRHWQVVQGYWICQSMYFMQIVAQREVWAAWDGEQGCEGARSALRQQARPSSRGEA